MEVLSSKPQLRLLLDHFATIKDTRQSWNDAYSCHKRAAWNPEYLLPILQPRLCSPGFVALNIVVHIRPNPGTDHDLKAIRH
jgi:hypothetical protein